MTLESISVVMHHSQSSGLVRLVMIGIANHDGDGGSWPSIKTLARYANCSERTVQRAINDLVGLGEIRIVPQAGGGKDMPDNRRPNRYDLLLDCPETCSGGRKHEEKSGVTLRSPQEFQAADPGVTDPNSRGDSPVAAGVTLLSQERPLEQNTKPTTAPRVDPSPADLLAVAILDGLKEARPALAAQMSRSGLHGVCQTLADLQWTPLQIRAWVAGSWQNWADVGPGVVVHRLRELGRPPEAPRSAVPARQDVCPEHPGVVRRVAGECGSCREESRAVDVTARAAAVKAARRPFPGSEPPTSPRGIELPFLAEGAAR